MAAPGGGMPYLNSHIVLISKSEIRYEGTLYTIDTTNSTVALQNVRSFGTEDRKPDNPIPASPEVFDYIIFRGTDIKDLHVCDPTSPNTGAAGDTSPMQPAAAPQPTAPVAPAPVASAAPPARAPQPAWGANPSQAKSAAPAAPVAESAPAAANKRGGRAQPGTGAHMSQRASRDVGGKGGSTAADDAEFDFQKMLAGFDKHTLMAEASSKVTASASYDKSSSFFDTLDEVNVEEGGKKGGRAFMAEMRKQDAQTFGVEFVKERGGRGGGGKGRGRGGGKGGGGGERGGGGGEGGGKGGGKGGGDGRGRSRGGRGNAENRNENRPQRNGPRPDQRSRDADTFGDSLVASHAAERRGGGGGGGGGGEGRGNRSGGGRGGGGKGGGRGRGRGGGAAAGPPPVAVSS